MPLIILIIIIIRYSQIFLVLLLLLLLFYTLGRTFPKGLSNKNRADMAVGPDHPGTRRCRAEELH